MPPANNHQHRATSGSDNGINNTNSHGQQQDAQSDTNNKQQHHQNQQLPTPLFERLVTEEVQELKAYARIIESQQRRLVELERVHGDLEGRLQEETRARHSLEKTLEAREREWTRTVQEVTDDCNHWKTAVQAEQTKNSRLMDQVVRKDQDIHRMLQRKYDNEGTRTRSVRQAGEKGGDRALQSNSKSPETRLESHKSPHEILAASGSAEKVRIRNMTGLLEDFFGI